MFFIGEFSSFIFKVIIDRYVLLLRNVDSGHHLGALLLPCSSLLVSPRKEFIHLPGTPIFVPVTWRTPADCLASRIYACSHRRLYIFAYFSKFLLRVWLPNPKFNCWGPPLWDTDLVHPQILGAVKNRVLGHIQRLENREVRQGWITRFISHTRPFLQDWER